MRRAGHCGVRWPNRRRVCSALQNSGGVLTNINAKPVTVGADAVPREIAEADPFVVDIARLLLTFFSVVILDVVAISLMTHRLRFWFPVWLDPQWTSRRDPWVVYSQSYFAGIFLIPVLCRVVDRDFLAKFGAATRTIFWSLCAIMFAFIIWWKGSLMLQYHKQYELLGWAALTGLMWMMFRRVEILPEQLRNLTRNQMLGGLLFGISLFFFIMSVLDPLVQLGFQGLPWSSGLAIEVGFFIPAGFALMMLSRRLRVRERHFV